MKTRIFNSSLYLISAYYISHVLYVISQYLLLSLLDVKGLKLYFFFNDYIAQENSWWSRTKVYAICGIGLFTILSLLIFTILYKLQVSRKKSRIKVFLNWLVIVLSAFIIADFASPSFFQEYTNFYFILRWTGFEHLGGGMYVITILSLLFIPLVSNFTYTSFLKMTNTTANIKTRKARMFFYFNHAFIPYLFLIITICSFIYVVYSYEDNYFLSREGIRLFIIGAIVLVGQFLSYNKKYLSIQKSNLTHIINVPMSILLIVSMLAYFFITNLN